MMSRWFRRRRPAAAFGTSHTLRAAGISPEAVVKYVSLLAPNTTTLATASVGEGACRWDCPAGHMTITSSWPLTGVVCWCGRSMVEGRRSA